MVARNRRYQAVLKKFSGIRLLVVGDLMLDRFLWGEVDRISPEAPVPVLRVTAESYSLGGAANVIHNIRSLGGQAVACGVLGRDEAGKRLFRQLSATGSLTSGVFWERAFQTTQKSRIIAQPRHQQIARLDWENHGDIEPALLRRVRRFVIRNARRCHGLVLSDYGKGVVHPELLNIVAEMARENSLLCVVDPKKENFGGYRFPTLVTPNREEASQAAGVEIRDEASLREAGKRLLQLWQAKAVLITRGQEGMSLFRPGREMRHFATAARELFEVTGAGDTVVAAAALALASGAAFEEAAVIANVAAGLVGEEVGPVAVPAHRLRKAFEGGT